MRPGAHLARWQLMSEQLTYEPRSEKPYPIDGLRAAIRANRISFPVPVPIFPSQHRADAQWRMAELYFVHGWSPDTLAQRYRVTSTRVRQALRNWVRRAKTLGYLQPIPAVEERQIALAAGAGGGWWHEPEVQPIIAAAVFLPGPESRQEHV
jgi:hypothetical protein